MGFTTGLLGGATLTYSILYLSLYLHQANRNVQHTLLRQQSALLNSVLDPQPPEPEPPAYEVRKAGLTEMLKDRWNREIENLVRTVQTTDWRAKREEWERKAGIAFQNVRETEKVQELEQRFKEDVLGPAEVTKQKLEEAARGPGAVIGGRSTTSGASVLGREPRLLELR